MDRRDFVRTVAAAGGTVAVAGLVAACTEEAWHGHAMTGPDLAPAGGGAVTRYPLRIPQPVDPGGLSLQAAPGTVGIIPGKSTPAWMYHGQFPAPTIVAQNGVRYTGVRFENSLAQESIIHWHGLLVESVNDGHPQQAVGPGSSYSYTLNVAQRATLNWYHPHPHMKTGEQVYRGLAGAFIVRDSVDTGFDGNPLGLPAGSYEIPLIIRDASFASRGNFQFSNKSSGFWGNTPLVNGTFAPYLGVNKGVYRFRMLNGCNARVLRLALNNGGAFALIGNDGGLLDQVRPVTEIIAAPGERFDILLDFSALNSGATVMLRDLDARWDILEFRGTGGASGTGSLPTPGGFLSTIVPLSAPVTTRRFTFDGMTRINGKVYDINAVEFTVPFEATERWTFVTNGNGPHPVHVHGAHFQVVSRTGGRGRLYDWERGWKDTVLVNDGESVDVLIRFTAHEGLYIMHCHQLAHEDAGMMANFEVVRMATEAET
jgi:FtsP/CotA-like multicopper oxidase with cupredoxin domain